jgi:two-component system CheB/CheR fusion protein
VVVRDSRDAILVQDLTGRIVAWNQGAERMYGWTETEALAMNVRDLMPGPNQDQALLALRQQSETGSLEPKRMPRLTKDGRTLEVSLVVSPLLDNAGKTYGIATTERAVVG